MRSQTWPCPHIFAFINLGCFSHEMLHAATCQTKLMKGSSMHALDHSRLYARHSPFLLRFPMWAVIIIPPARLMSFMPFRWLRLRFSASMPGLGIHAPFTKYIPTACAWRAFCIFFSKTQLMWTHTATCIEVRWVRHGFIKIHHMLIQTHRDYFRGLSLWWPRISSGCFCGVIILLKANRVFDGTIVTATILPAHKRSITCIVQITLPEWDVTPSPDFVARW